MNTKLVRYNPGIIYDKKNRSYYIPAMWDDERSRISDSNKKTGYISINKLPGDMNTLYDGSYPKVLYNFWESENVRDMVRGTCPFNCPGCYAKKIYRNIIPAIKATINTWENNENTDRFYDNCEREIFDSGKYDDRNDVIRLDDSGEIKDLGEMLRIIKLANCHPETIIIGFTERHELLDICHDLIPDNLRIKKSAFVKWIDHDPNDKIKYCFVDIGEKADPRIKALPHCRAVDENGHRITGMSCRKCGMCKGNKTDIAISYHGTKKGLSEILAMLFGDDDNDNE